MARLVTSPDMADPDVQEEQNKYGDEYGDDPVHSTCSFLLK